MARRICIVTAGHLATCPRAVRIADALALGGYSVRVVSARFLDWADAADQDLRRTRNWDWSQVDYRREAGAGYWMSGMRWRGSQRAAGWIGIDRAPLWILRRAYGRVYPELLAMALEEPADLFYGCSNGGMAPAAEAGRSSGKPYALDLEDFHSAENPRNAEGVAADAIAGRLEQDLLPAARLLTAGSGAIAEAYRDKYGKRPVPLFNVFPLPQREPDLSPRAPGRLELRWVGQTLGPGKGLHTVVRAAGIAGIDAKLATRGRAVAGYAEDLVRLAKQVAPRLVVSPLPPVTPAELPAFCAEGDVGVAPVQTKDVFNHEIALPNKAFFYMTSGLAVAMGRSEGHRELAADVGEGAVVYDRDDPHALAEGLRRWGNDPDSLLRSRRAAWQAVRRRWNWNVERESLLEAVAGVWRE